MKVYVVIDTNVLVSALLSKHSDSATVKVVEAFLEGNIVPLFNGEIVAEYSEVLNRPKFNLPPQYVTAIIGAVTSNGLPLHRTPSSEQLPDPKDVVFYEVALSKEGSFLVTGNIKHFPSSPIVVTPSELLKILENQVSK